MAKLLAGFAALVVVTGAVLETPETDWLSKVPDADRVRVSPVAGQSAAVEAGKRLYDTRCAKCHGPDGNGRPGRPSLRTARVTSASDGELFWLLQNGIRDHGMPAWASLPELQRWQIIAYTRTLPSAPLAK